MRTGTFPWAAESQETGGSSDSRGLGLGSDSGFEGARRRTIGTGALLVLSLSTLTLLVQRFDAPLVLAGSLLLLAAIPLLLRPELATLLTVFLLYINFPAILTKQHGLPSVVAGSFILLLSIPLVHLLIIRRAPLKADVAFSMMLLYLGVLLVSSLGAIDKGIALRAALEYVLEGLLIYWLVINVVRALRTLRGVIWTLLLAGGLLSALSLYQTATGSYEQEFGGLAYRNFETVEDGWDRDGPAKRRTWDRAHGPVNEPNRFAQILIVLLPLAVFMYRTSSAGRPRLCAAGLGLLMLAGVALTLSRGGFLALILMTATMMVLRWIPVSRVLICLLIFALTAPAVPFFLDRMMSITGAGSIIGGEATTSREADGATLGRATVMLAALYTFRDHPVLGVGPGQFPPFYSQAYSRDPAIKFRDMPPGAWRAHSLYLEIAAETGALGLAVFLTIVGVVLRRLWRARRDWQHSHPEFSDLATALCLSLLAYQLTGVFLHLAYQRYYWFLLAITGAALHIIHSHRRAEEAGGFSVRPGPVLGLQACR